MSEQSKIDAERAAFEAWYAEYACVTADRVKTLRSGCGYREEYACIAWSAWQARASLPVGVPDVSELQRLLDDVRDVRSADDVAFGWYEAVERMLAAAPTVKAEQVDMADAYVGAREDLAIWKRRALEAEQKVRHQEQIIDHLTLEEQGETRFGEPSMPSAEPVAVIEYAGYDPANSIKWLSKGLQYMEPGTFLYAQAPSLPAAGSAVEAKALRAYDQPVRVAIKMLERTLSPTAMEIAAELRRCLGDAQDALSAQQSAPEPPLEQAGKLLVSAEPLRQVLNALVNAPHMIRELQATREPVALFADNPINVLIAEFNAAHGGE